MFPFPFARGSFARFAYDSRRYVGTPSGEILILSLSLSLPLVDTLHKYMRCNLAQCGGT